MSSSVPRSDKNNNKGDKRSPDYDRAYDPSVPDADLTAAEYLRRQGERAKAAMMGTAAVVKSATMEKARHSLPGMGGNGDGESGSSDPLKLVRQYPWYSVGGATVLGFLGALYLNPSRFGRLKGRIKKLEKRLEEQEAMLSGSPPRKGGDTKAETAAKSSIVSSLGTLVVTQGMNALKPLLTQYVGPMMAGRAPAPDPYGGEEGYPPGQPYPNGPQPASAAAEAAAEERFGGHAPPRASGDPSI